MMLMSIMAFSPRAHLDRMKAKAGAKVAEECPTLVQVRFPVINYADGPWKRDFCLEHDVES